MEPSNLFKALIFIITGGISIARGNSGGWVGNSPIAAYTPVIAFQSYYSEEDVKEWNSILLPDGQSRASVRVTFCDTCRFSKTSLDFGYDYAFTPKLTTFGFGIWGYSLKSGNGVGSEWALLFGLVDGLIDSTTFGTSLGPGVGISYAYSEPHWRLDFSSTVGGYFNVDHHYWGSFQSRSEMSFTKWLSDNWGVGLSEAYIYRSGYSKTISCGVNCSSTDELESFNGFLDPKIYALFQVNKIHEVNLGFRRSLDSDRSITSLGYSYRW
ncbi:MAG: hypothetical protein H7256_16445 [Bdellovibrio sp.]|nr:hypothetical protein [Bdellovibrio sp.]